MPLTLQDYADIIQGKTTVGDIVNAQQGASMQTPGDQYLAQIDPQNIGNLFGQAQDIYAQEGGSAVREYNRPDDMLALVKMLYGVQQDFGQQQYDQSQDQAKLGLLQRQDTREQGAYDLKYGSTEGDISALDWAGITPDKAAQIFETQNPQGLDLIAEAIGARNPNYDPNAEPSDSNKEFDYRYAIPRLVAIEQHQDSMKQAMQQQADEQVKQERWGSLTPEQRAKEAFLQLSSDPTSVVKGEKVFTGADAEKQAARYKEPTWLTMDQIQSKYPTKKKSTTGVSATSGENAGRVTYNAQRQQNPDLIDQWLNEKPIAAGEFLNRNFNPNLFIQPGWRGFTSGAAGVSNWLGNVVGGSSGGSKPKDKLATPSSTTKTSNKVYRGPGARR